ncbi:hypothetical protein L9F63_000549, partial [Diploptera punctata]
MRIRACEMPYKPFKCSFCNTSFTRKHHLFTHVRTHNNEKLFNCFVCNKSFALFSRKDILNTYLVIHSGEKPFKCNFFLMRSYSIVPYSFSQKSGLIVHLHTHNEKQFKCSVCHSHIGAFLIIIYLCIMGS